MSSITYQLNSLAICCLPNCSQDIFLYFRRTYWPRKDCEHPNKTLILYNMHDSSVRQVYKFNLLQTYMSAFWYLCCFILSLLQILVYTTHRTNKIYKRLITFNNLICKLSYISSNRLANFRLKFFSINSIIIIVLIAFSSSHWVRIFTS